MPILSSDELTVEIAERGAELRSIRDADGGEWLWNGDPAWWSGRAPLLFPLVGRSPDDTVSIAGKSYPMKQHGFARTSTSPLKAPTPRRLSDSHRQRRDARLPFAFTLTLSYLDGSALSTTATVKIATARPCRSSSAFIRVSPGRCPGQARRIRSLAAALNRH
ncbi:hypothetical protein [Devosia sp.]|uniref:aldose epimerase family protein n=1 Tax=Devosia sp. TaxID=1871048 RepID=UPI003A9561E2